jgi:LCP family protein required for cell wall assembly
MSKKLGFLVLLITLSCVLFAGIGFVYWWYQPLGEPLMIPALTSEPISSNNNDGLGTEISATTPTSEKPMLSTNTTVTTETTPLAAETPTPEEPELMYILAAGTDTRYPGYRGGLADVIRIVRIDLETPKVTVLTLPRDLWVELPGMSEEFEYITHGKINTAYTHGIPHLGRYAGEGGGPGLLAHTIAHNYGLVVDHYAVVNMEVFVDIIDALHGIDLYLNRTWDGRDDRDNPDHDAWVFEEGQHHMKGEEALRFARIRLNYSEITRTDNQTLVLCAIREKMTRPNIFASLPNLVNAFIGRVQTDLSPAQISRLISLLPKLGPENLLFIRFPNEMFVQGRAFDPFSNNSTFIWDIPIEDIRQFISDFEQDNITIEIGGGGGRRCP